MSNILIIIGTRPEAIKLAPIYIEMKNRGLNPQVLTTGQHTGMTQDVLNFFNIKSDFDLILKRKSNTLTELTTELFVEIERALMLIQPKIVIVQGDTTSAFVGSLCAFYNKIKVAHVEAGLRTDEKYSPFPEEVNRRMISEIVDFHFAPTSRSADNLFKKDKVFITGNTVVDSLLIGKSIIERKSVYYSKKYYDILEENGKNILITGHRRESFGKGFENICEAIFELAEEFHDYNFIYPVHLNPSVREVVEKSLGGLINVILLEPLPYDDLLYFMSQSKLIMTDSGGIQEEGPSFNVPIIVMRNHTERQEGIDANCSVLAGVNKEKIKTTFKQIMLDPNIYQSMTNLKNPYGDGTASKQIVDIISNTVINHN